MSTKGFLEFYTNDTAHQSMHVFIHPSERTALLNGRKHAAFIDFLYNHWHCKHGGRLDNLQSLHQKRSNRGLGQIIHGCTGVHRIKHTQCHLQRVCHRENRKPSVFLGSLARMVAGNHIGSQISMAQNHPFCASGSSGSINNGRNIIRSRR